LHKTAIEWLINSLEHIFEEIVGLLQLVPVEKLFYVSG
jgi:hypothetical protein